MIVYGRPDSCLFTCFNLGSGILVTVDHASGGVGGVLASLTTMVKECWGCSFLIILPLSGLIMSAVNSRTIKKKWLKIAIITFSWLQSLPQLINEKIAIEGMGVCVKVSKWLMWRQQRTGWIEVWSYRWWSQINRSDWWCVSHECWYTWDNEA